MTSPSASEEAAPEKNPAAHVPCDAELKENEESLALKGQGNEAYRAGDFRKALELFSAAIAIDKVLPPGQLAHVVWGGLLARGATLVTCFLDHTLAPRDEFAAESVPWVQSFLF